MARSARSDAPAPEEVRAVEGKPARRLLGAEELLGFVLDPVLGCPWPEGEPASAAHPFRPRWRLGDRWRVEVTARAPALAAEALVVGSAVRGVFRFEVVGEEEREGERLFILMVSQEGAPAGAASYRLACRAADLTLASVERFVDGSSRGLLDLGLPRLAAKRRLLRGPTGEVEALERTFTLREEE